MERLSDIRARVEKLEQLVARDGGSVKPHDFRCFVGTELAKRDLRQAQQALGYQRLEMTVQHYVLDVLQPGLTEGLF